MILIQTKIKILLEMFIVFPNFLPPKAWMSTWGFTALGILLKLFRKLWKSEICKQFSWRKILHLLQNKWKSYVQTESSKLKRNRINWMESNKLKPYRINWIGIETFVKQKQWFCFMLQTLPIFIKFKIFSLIIGCQ